MILSILGLIKFVNIILKVIVIFIWFLLLLFFASFIEKTCFTYYISIVEKEMNILNASLVKLGYSF